MNGRTRRTWERIYVGFYLGSEHGDPGWKALEEKNGIETPNGGLIFFKKNEILMPHHGCVTKMFLFSQDTTISARSRGIKPEYALFKIFCRVLFRFYIVCFRVVTLLDMHMLFSLCPV
jgi:hypothetical protein